MLSPRELSETSSVVPEEATAATETAIANAAAETAIADAAA